MPDQPPSSLVADAWRDGLPIWWAIQDDLAIERGDPTLSSLVREAFDRFEARFRPAQSAPCPSGDTDCTVDCGRCKGGTR